MNFEVGDFFQVFVKKIDGKWKIDLDMPILTANREYIEELI